MEKEALSDDLLKILTYVVPFVVASNVGGYFIPKMLEKVELSNRKKHTQEKWYKLLSKYPQMAQDPKSRDYFEALANLYPHLADHPEAIVSALRIAQDYATEGIDPNTLKTLSDAERGIVQSLSDRYTSAKDLFAASKSISDINKEIDGGGSMGGISWGLT
jgi:hypothetical protein